MAWVGGRSLIRGRNVLWRWSLISLGACTLLLPTSVLRHMLFAQVWPLTPALHRWAPSIVKADSHTTSSLKLYLIG